MQCHEKLPLLAAFITEKQQEAKNVKNKDKIIDSIFGFR